MLRFNKLIISEIISYLDFNTSYVTVQLIIESKHNIRLIISIHLMLRFNGFIFFDIFLK